MKLTDFDKVQVLAVDFRYQILQGLVAQMAERNTDLDIFMTGQGLLLPTEMYSFLDEGMSWNNTQKCYRNHREMLMRAIEQDLDNILLLEDDCEFLNGFDELLDTIPADLDYDILYLGANHTWGKTEEITPNLLRCHGGTYCCHAMAVKRRMFKPLLDLPFHWWVGPLDYWIATKIQTDPRYRCYSLWPNLAIQSPGHSYLVGSEQDYSSYFRAKGECVNG